VLAQDVCSLIREHGIRNSWDIHELWHGQRTFKLSCRLW
jgi:hypothetical protein